jgi:hypothetical protein
MSSVTGRIGGSAYVREQVVHLLQHDLARELPSHGAACAHTTSAGAWMRHSDVPHSPEWYAEACTHVSLGVLELRSAGMAPTAPTNSAPLDGPG